MDNEIKDNEVQIVSIDEFSKIFPNRLEYLNFHKHCIHTCAFTPGSKIAHWVPGFNVCESIRKCKPETDISKLTFPKSVRFVDLLQLRVMDMNISEKNISYLQSHPSDFEQVEAVVDFMELMLCKTKEEWLTLLNSDEKPLKQLVPNKSGTPETVLPKRFSKYVL
jgi:hypothetical protein